MPSAIEKPIATAIQVGRILAVVFKTILLSPLAETRRVHARVPGRPTPRRAETHQLAPRGDANSKPSSSAHPNQGRPAPVATADGNGLFAPIPGIRRRERDKYPDRKTGSRALRPDLRIWRVRIPDEVRLRTAGKSPTPSKQGQSAVVPRKNPRFPGWGNRGQRPQEELPKTELPDVLAEQRPRRSTAVPRRPLTGSLPSPIHRLRHSPRRHRRHRRRRTGRPRPVLSCPYRGAA